MDVIRGRADSVMRKETARGVQFDFDVHAGDGRSIRATWLTATNSELQENDPVVVRGELNANGIVECREVTIRPVLWPAALIVPAIATGYGLIAALFYASSDDFVFTAILCASYLVLTVASGLYLGRYSLTRLPPHFGRRAMSAVGAATLLAMALIHWAAISDETMEYHDPIPAKYPDGLAMTVWVGALLMVVAVAIVVTLRLRARSRRRKLSGTGAARSDGHDLRNA